MQYQRRLLRVVLSIFVLSLFLSWSNGVQSVAAQAKKEKSLYQRLGGYDAIAAVVDDFIVRLAGDQRFEKFFAGFSVDSKKRIRQHLLDQLCVATGGPCVYLGRDMKTTHEGLGLTEADWNAGNAHLAAALDKFKVPKKEKGEVLAFVMSLKKDIVEK